MRRTAGFLAAVTLFLAGAAARADEDDAPTAAPGGPGVPAAPVSASPPRTATRASSASLPFRLGVCYSQAYGQSGNLARGPNPAAVGLDIALGAGSSIRYHLGVAHEWESRSPYSARGFRFDLVSLGFPIEVLNDNNGFVIHVEPIARIVRGEILFPSNDSFPGNNNDNGAIFRVESGIGVAVTAVINHWYVGLEPVSVDFRTFTATTHTTSTGFSRVLWFQLTAGREF